MRIDSSDLSLHLIQELSQHLDSASFLSKGMVICKVGDILKVVRISRTTLSPFSHPLIGLESSGQSKSESLEGFQHCNKSHTCSRHMHAWPVMDIVTVSLKYNPGLLADSIIDMAFVL